MEMNQTAQSIRLHEQELKVMMMEVKNMMTNIKKLIVVAVAANVRSNNNASS